MHHPTDRITHTTAFVAPVVEHWLEREIAQMGPPHVYIYTQSNLDITTTQGTNEKWSLWTRGLYMEVVKYSTIP